MTVLQVVQLIAAIIGMLVVLVTPIAYVMKMNGQVNLLTELFTRLDKKVDKIDSSVTTMHETILRAAVQPAPRRAGRGRRDKAAR